MAERASNVIDRERSGGAQRAVGIAASLAGLGEAGGIMARRVLAHDWAATPLGPMASWSPALRMVVRMVLSNAHPIILWWGPHYIQLFNDPYRSILGTKEPTALGQRASECFAEIWDVIAPLIDEPFHGGPATWDEDILVEIERYGFPDEGHFTIAYSPVPDETAPGGIGGVLANVHEITEQVLGKRRIAVLRDLGACASEANSARQACELAARTLAAHDKDLPFALFYLISADRKRAMLEGVTGVQPGTPMAPTSVDLEADSACSWPLAQALRVETMQRVEPLAARFPQVPPGPWSDPPHTAVVVPIPSNTPHQSVTLMVVGISARLRFDQAYRDFLGLMTTQVATLVANARAYEDERRRADALAELDRAKTAFFSNVSHEFRTPLTLMLGPMEDTLANTDLPEAVREQLDVAHRNALRLLKLVNTMLDFSRIEAGRATARFEPTDLAAFTGELASNFRSACERAGLTFAVDCPPLSQPVWVDRDMWEKLVLNLLSNAFKFTFDGGITVRLRRHDDQAMLTVSDSGTGIADDDLPRLFERFHRIAGQRSRTHEGSGIGLALVQELVKLHGGAIRATSVIGQGTVFTVEVPLGSRHLPAESVTAAALTEAASLHADAFVDEALRWLPDAADNDTCAPFADLPAGALDAHRGAHVLIAEDNADMRAYLRRLLAPHCEVHTVADGASARKAIGARRPDLVLADVMMPMLDGFGLLQSIRADEATRDLPVILLSARAGEEARLEGLGAGADDYLVKPFSARELIARVDGNLRLAGARREAMQALRESEERLQLALDAAGMGTFVCYPSAYDGEPDERMLQLFGLPGDASLTLAQAVATRVHPDDRTRYGEALAQAFQSSGDGRLQCDIRVVYADGSVHWLAISGQAFFAGDPRHVTRIAGTGADITVHKRADEGRLVLIAELQHRTRNLIGVVRSIAQQTRAGSADLDHFGEQFDGRLRALADVQALLSRSHAQPITLRALIDMELQALGAVVGDGRVHVDGPRVRIVNANAQTLALAIHELATNARKYGALASAEGHLQVRWHVQGKGSARHVLIDWHERGIQAPSSASRRGSGYGRELIEKALPYALAARTHYDLSDSQLHCRIELPLVSDWTGDPE